MEVIIFLILLGVGFAIIRKHTPIKVSSALLTNLLRKKKISREQYEQIRQFETEEQIKKWQKAGLITKEQAQSILAPCPKKIKWLSISTALLWLGLGCILIGIIAIIAANYDKIPPMVRLSTTFVLFLISCWGCFNSWIQSKQKRIEYFIVASTALIGALIGLVCQTFQLQGNMLDAICLWTILALPFIALSKFKAWAVAWYPTLIISFLGSTCGQEIIELLAHYNPVVILITISCIAFEIYKLMAVKLSHHPFTQVLKWYVLLWCGCAVVLIDALYMSGALKYFVRYLNLINSIPAYILMCLTLVPLFIFSAKNKLLGAYTVFLALFGWFSGVMVFPIMGTLFTLITLSFLVAYCANNNKLRLFNTICIAFFLRIVLAYINLFMSLLHTGIGAIILGVLILTGVYLWSKKRQNLINYIQKGK